MLLFSISIGTVCAAAPKDEIILEVGRLRGEVK